MAYLVPRARANRKKHRIAMLAKFCEPVESHGVTYG